ncbi:MAG TPA: hypothetical protein VEW48_05670 [Thermoanaerobaculia bacterium]|nr:hypothetical protein [Thermoanaerobaculia bacterium]
MWEQLVIPVLELLAVGATGLWIYRRQPRPFGWQKEAAKAAAACGLQVVETGPASPGQLSLAGTEAGQLSLAQSEAGQLSLAPEAAGQLSLPPEVDG